MPRNLICELNCGIDMCAIRSWWQKQLHAVFLIRGHYCIVLVCQDSVFLLRLSSCLHGTQTAFVQKYTRVRLSAGSYQRPSQKWYKLPPCIGTHALELEFGSAAQLSKRPGSVMNCLWGNALKRSPGIIRKSRVSYPGPGFLSSATWPSLPKKHYNGLNQTNPMKSQ